MANAVIPGHGGEQFFGWSLTLAILGLAGIVTSLGKSSSGSSSSMEAAAVFAAIAFPAYVALQLIPVPLGLLRIFDPTRAEIAEALGSVTEPPRHAALSLSPLYTWAQLSHIAGYALVFLVIRQLTRRRAALLWSAVPLLAIGGFEAALGLIQRSNGEAIVSGTYFNKDHFAGLIEMILPFAFMYCLAIFYRGRERRGSAVLCLVMGSALLSVSLAMFSAITVSLSKAGFLSMVGSLFVMGAVSLGVTHSGWKRWTTIAGLTAIAVLILAFLPTVELINSFGTVTSDTTAEGRWPIAKNTLQMIAAYPLTGVGLGAYYSGLQRYQTYGFDVAWIYAHNDYLQLLSELGFVGFIIPALLILSVLVLSLRGAVTSPSRECRYLGLACTGGITAILIHSCADFNLYVPANALVLSWISGIAAGIPRRRDEKRSVTGVSKPLIPVFIGVLGCLASLYAGAWLIYIHWFQDDVRTARAFCNFGVCDANEALTALEQKHGGETASVPPADLIEFLRLDPAVPFNWLVLGESLKRVGRIAEARACMDRALALGPREPGTLFQASRFHLSLGEREQALKLMLRALEGSPSQSQVFLGEYDKWRVPPEQVVSHGLPARPEVWRSYLRAQIQQDRVADSNTVWNAIVAHNYADGKMVNEYISFLIRAGRSEVAAKAWSQYTGKRDREYPDANRIFNGDFESEPTGSSFDWNIEQTPGANIDFDTASPHAGARSLRIEFDGTQNLTNIHVAQTVFLTSGRYRFQAYVRSNDVSTDEGISFQIASDRAPKQLSFTTEPVLGSMEWTPTQHSFNVPQTAAGLVEVRLVRTASLRFDNLIKGTLWIDQVSISSESTLLASLDHSRQPSLSPN